MTLRSRPNAVGRCHRPPFHPFPCDTGIHASGCLRTVANERALENKDQGGAQWGPAGETPRMRVQDPSQRGTLSSAGVDAGTLQRAAHLLGEHNRGLESLQRHLQRVERDVALVHNEVNRQMLTFVVPTAYPRKA